MRRASTLFHQLRNLGKETCSETPLGATVTGCGHGYRTVIQGLHNHVETNAAAAGSSCGDWLAPPNPHECVDSEADVRPRLLGRDSDCNADTPSPFWPSGAIAESSPHLHHSPIGPLPTSETPLSSSWSPARPSAKLPGAPLKLPLQQSVFGFQQSLPVRKQWDHKRHHSWCSHDGRGYSSRAVDMVQREHDDNDTITVSSTEHEKRCGMCLKVRRLREFQPQRSSPDGVHYWCRGCAAQLSRARRGLAAGVVAGQAHCPCCGEVKDRALFGLESRQRSGLQKICRACVAEDYQTRPNVTGRSERKWPVWAQERRPMVITLRRKEGLWVPTEKVCLTCGELKSAGEYFSDPTKMDGLRQYCKPCWCRKHSVHPSRRVKRPKHPEAPVIPSVMMDEVRAAFRWLVGDEQKMPDAARRETERQKSLQSTSRGAE